jgi:environmental stress-induced protein Ves
MQVIRSDALPVSRWRNGAGRKADIAAGAGWMAGFAWLDEDAPFSEFAGQDRTITLLQGPGFTLDGAGGPLVVDTPFAPARFDGGATTQCRVVAPCRVLNVMTARTALWHSVAIIPAAGAVAPDDAAVCLLVAVHGAASIIGPSTAELAPLDAVRLDGPVTITGSEASRLACIRIGPSP